MKSLQVAIEDYNIAIDNLRIVEQLPIVSDTKTMVLNIITTMSDEDVIRQTNKTKSEIKILLKDSEYITNWLKFH